MKPSDFKTFPDNSVYGSDQAEVIALNIMKILARTGDTFRTLGWEEYKEERLKDGNFTEVEGILFTMVIGYCKSADTAVLFSSAWKQIAQ